MDPILAREIETAHDKIGPLDTLINEYYLSYRNRVHFGKNKLSEFHGKKLYFPLMSANLYFASEKLSQEDRADGKIIFDLLELLEPKLLDIPFSSEFPYWERNKKESISFEKFPSEKKNEWLEASRRYAASRDSNVRHFPPKFDSPVGALEEDSCETLYCKFLHSLERILAADRFGLFNPGELCERIIDLYCRSRAQAEELMVFVIGLSAFYKYGSETAKFDLEKYRFPLIDNPILTVDCEQYPGGLRVEASHTTISDEKVSLLWQCHLYIGGKAVYKTSLSQSPIFDLVLEEGVKEPAEIRVVCRNNYQKFLKKMQLTLM